MSSDSSAAPRLHAGAAQCDITPWAGVQLGGDVGSYRPAKLVLDPLHARAFVVQSGERKCCIVSLDLCVVAKPYCDHIRTAAAARWGFAFDAVMVNAIQTHTGPSLGHFMADDELDNIPADCEWLRGGDLPYADFVVEKTLEAIAQAMENLQPVSIGVGSGIEGRYAFNRRAICRDGSILMPWRKWSGPLGPTQILYMEGPIDPEVGVVCFRTDDLRPLAMLVNHTCHPVHVFPKPLVSADWPGAWAAELVHDYGEQLVPLVLNGCCGNINPWPPFDPNYVEDHRKMGKALAEMTAKVLDEITYVDSAEIDWRVRKLHIPCRTIDPAELAAARAMLAEHPTPWWTDETHTCTHNAWFMAATLVSLYLEQQRMGGVFEYEVQVFRIGDTAFVGLPGEPFAEGGLKVKLASPAQHTYVVHMINQYVGYLPTKEGASRPGHESSARLWSKLVPEALDIVTDNAIEMLQELFAGVAVG